MGLVRWLLRKLGARPSEKPLPRDLSDADRRIIRSVRPFTMTTVERIAALIQAVRYVARHRIPGDIVECGVWRGGSMMAAALTLIEEKDTSRHLHLFDTYTGMTAPSAADRRFDDVPARQLEPLHGGQGGWCASAAHEVRANLLSTGYPADRLHFVEGKVEDTIPGNCPAQLALVRLDTDWYASTRHELEHLFPRLSSRGILILDDYGHWQGARQATDEYFDKNREPIFLHRIDYSGRLAVKI
jgi:hypothetical protein